MSCIEPLALPSRSPVRSSLSGPPRLSSARPPEAQSLARSSTSDGGGLRQKQSDRALWRGALADPYIPGRTHLHMPSGSHDAVPESAGIPPDAINIPFPFLRCSRPPSVFLNPFRFLPPFEYYPVIYQGKSSLFVPRLSKARRKGSL